MILTEFDEEAYEKTIRQEGWEDGCNYGKNQKLISLIRKNTAKGLSCAALAELLEEPEDHIASLIRLIQEHPNETDEELLNRLLG